MIKKVSPDTEGDKSQITANEPLPTQADRRFYIKLERKIGPISH